MCPRELKKTLYIVSVLLVALLMVGLMLLGALASPKVQTSAVHMVTSELTRALGTQAHVGKIEYRFPARLTIQDVYIADAQHDTLLYVNDLYAHFRPLALLQGQVYFSKINLDGVRIDAHKMDNGEYNYQYLIDLFPKDTSDTEMNVAFRLDKMSLTDIRMRYDEHQAYLEHAAIKLRNLSQDSIDAEIMTMAGSYHTNQAGLFDVKDLSARLIINDTLLSVPTLYARLPRSEMDASGVRIQFPAGDTLFLSRSARDIRSRLYINKAAICPADLGIFFPTIATLDGIVSFTGGLEGSLDSLSATDLAVYYKQHCLIRGDVSMVGLPRLSETHLAAHCQELSLNAIVAQDFISDLQNKPYSLPAELKRLGATRYRGTIEGKLTDLTLQGAFHTDLGTITTDGRLQSDTTFTNLAFNGKIASRRLRMGRMLPHSGLGDVRFDITTKGRIREGEFPSGDIHAHISELQFKGYSYRDLCLHGNYSYNSFDGNLSIDNENIGLEFSGICDRTQGLHYDFDLKLKRFLPERLHLLPNDYGMAMNMHVNMSGFDPNKMSGYLVIDSLKLRNENDSLLMRQIELIAECDTLSPLAESRKTVQINSDFFSAKIWGEYAYTTLQNSFMQLVQRHLPSIYSPSQAEQIKQSRAQNVLNFYIYGRELKALQRVLQMPWRIADYPVVRGEINDNTGVIQLQAYAENIRSRARRFNDLTLTLNNSSASGQRSSLNVGFSLAIPADTIIIAPKEHSAQPEPVYMPASRVSLDCHVRADSVLCQLQGINTDEQRLTTDFSAVAKLSRFGGKPLVNVHVRPSLLQYFGVKYHVAESDISYCVADTLLAINHFAIESDQQFVRANGIASTHMTDSLELALGHIDASTIMPFILNEEVLTVQGDVNGWGKVYGAFSQPMFSAGAVLYDAGLNGQRLGDVNASVTFDKPSTTILIDGDVYRSLRDTVPTHLVAHVDGRATPLDKRWFLDITPDSIPLGFINHWTEAFISNINGTASGSVQVFGYKADVWVTAKAKANDVSLVIPFTGCQYSVSDSIYMDSTSIRFPDITIHDIEGNPIYFSGILRHEVFKDFNLDLQATPKHAMALNLPDKKGELLSGRVYADGLVRIYGPDNDIHLDATAATYGKSRLRLTIDGASSAHDNSFITFVDHDSTHLIVEQVEEDEFASMIQKEEEQWRQNNKFTLSLGADVTPGTLLFQLMLNSGTGDMIQARGEGSVRFGMDPNEDISLVGTYTLQSGSLGFTVGNMIRRDFIIAEGSQISFAGNPEDPTLDVTAKYKVTASLRDLFGDDISMLATSRTSVPVNCCVHMTGRLSNPIMQFAIELPMSEDAIRNQVRAIINTDEMLMRQVVYLLIFGRFFTPDYLQNTSSTGVNEVYSILSSTITGQINSWLGKLTNVFSMGVNIRTEGEGATSSQEYEAQFQLQPVDRLVINGNVGYRYNDISNRPFFGDVDIEYMLTPNGKIRLKAYTHTVDKYSLRQASTIQGVGLLFKHDFNWSDLKKK